MKLFHEYAEEPAKDTRKHWIFLGSIVVGFVALFVLVAILIIWMLAEFFSHEPRFVPTV